MRVDLGKQKMIKVEFEFTTINEKNDLSALKEFFYGYKTLTSNKILVRFKLLLILSKMFNAALFF